MVLPARLPARILVVDDHEVALEGIRSLLGREPDLCVAAVATTGGEAVRLAAGTAFDVAIVDLGLPDVPGEDVVLRLAMLPAAPAIVALAMGAEKEPIRAAIAAGARGLTSKAAPPEDLVRSVRAALQGESFVSATVANVVLDLARQDPGGHALDAIERGVLRGIARGESTEGIAAALGVSGRRVEATRARLKTRLGARGTADLVRHALAVGLVDE